MPAWNPPSAFTEGNTIAATPHDAAWDSVAALLNVVGGDPTTGLDEANIRYMASIFPLQFSLDGALADGVQKHIYITPYPLYPIQISAALGGVAGATNTTRFQVAWSTDAWTTVNGILTGATVLTGGDTVATPFSGTQLSSLAIPANAQIRLQLDLTGITAVDLSVLLLCKVFHRVYDLNPT